MLWCKQKSLNGGKDPSTGHGLFVRSDKNRYPNFEIPHIAHSDPRIQEKQPNATLFHEQQISGIIELHTFTGTYVFELAFFEVDYSPTVNKILPILFLLSTSSCASDASASVKRCPILIFNFSSDKYRRT